MDFRKLTIRDIELAGKTVLVRVDYNVPLKDGAVAEDMRIRASLPTINYLLENGAKKVILISHLGRPEGQVNPEFSLAPVASVLASLLEGKEVRFVDETIDDKVKAAVADLPDGGVLLLENLRFSPAEEENSRDFAKAIIDATGADTFVQDGFAVIHRAHASTDAIARILPGVAGFLVEKEVFNLEAAINAPEHPLVVIIGGAKVDDKAPMIEKFLPIADQILVGGKIAADGYQATDPKIYVADSFVTNEEGAKLDVSPESTAHMLEILHDAKTVVWNGTMGMVEDERFALSSRAVAQEVGTSDAMTIIGGGDTAGFVEGEMRKDPSLAYSLVSTGGGASLELLSGKALPGFEVLRDR